MRIYMQICVMVVMTSMLLTHVSGNAECSFNETTYLDDCGHGCLNGGTCQVIPGVPEDSSCTCPDGFTGQYCDIEVILCDETDCYNGGTCNNNDSNDIYCDCPSGFTGGLCETDMRCSPSNPCLNGGTCQNEDCTCPEGVSGYLCDTVYAECGCHPDIDCPSETSCPCCLVGELCEAEEEPTDEAPTGEAPSEGNAVCYSDETTYLDNCGHGCLNGGTCQVIPDDPEYNSCTCPDGFTGQYCDIEVIRCSDETDCQNGGQCNIESDPSSNYCDCPTGFTGRLCETDMRCSDNNPCLNGGTCENEDCVCPPGVSGYLCDTVYAECGCHPDIECPSETSCPCCLVGELCEAEEEPTEDGGSSHAAVTFSSKLGLLLTITLGICMKY